MFVGVDEKLSIVADVLLRCVSYQLLQQATARTNERVTTTFIMESIIRRTIVVVEERVGGQLVNRAIKEVRSPLVCLHHSTLCFVCFYTMMIMLMRWWFIWLKLPLSTVHGRNQVSD